MHVTWHHISADEAGAQLGSSLAGLSKADAGARLTTYGPNELRYQPAKSAWAVLAAQLRSIVTWLLVAAGVISAVVGDPIDAIVILAVLVFNVGLGFALELHAERALDALRRLEARRATVLRNGHLGEIDARELVPGDVVVFESGQAIPADARLIAATELRMTEAALTGESTSVHKQADVICPAGTSLADRRNMVYAGTSVATGAGRGLVVATGVHTELGRIGRLVAATDSEKTPLERRLDALGERLVWISLTLGAAMTCIGVARGEDLFTVLEAGIALAVAAVPEGLPAIATITLALGIRRMARRHALIRRLPSVEALGSVTLIATDKTGTLTSGAMTVTTVWTGADEFTLTGSGYAPFGTIRRNQTDVDPRESPGLERVLTIGALVNHAHVEEREGQWTAVGDTTEAALVAAAAKAGLSRAALLADWPEQGEVPFSSERKFMATFHRRLDGELWACVKGAPSRVVRFCDDFSVLGGGTSATQGRLAVLDHNRLLAASGLRVLAVADGPVADTSHEPTHLRFAGLIGMTDPPASEVATTLGAFRAAGIRTVMITGDQRQTAERVAVEVGILAPGDHGLDAREIEAMSDDQLALSLATHAVFSRVSPEIKLRLVRLFQQRGEVVAMLGDGVNDAPALKKADVGVAMGGRGSDVARETAAVVLQNDRFETIGVAIEEGRVIYDNIQKFTFYLFSCNLAEVLVLLGGVILGFPLALQALQILWLNLVTDTAPALALAFEPGEPGVMQRPPRDPKQPLLSRNFLSRVLFYALLIAGATTLAMRLTNGDSRTTTTVTFATLGFAQLLHLGNARSGRAVLQPDRVAANVWALVAVVFVGLMQVLAIHYPPLSNALGTTPLGAWDWLLVAGCSVLPAVIGQALKLARPRRDAFD